MVRFGLCNHVHRFWRRCLVACSASLISILCSFFWICVALFSKMSRVLIFFLTSAMHFRNFLSWRSRTFDVVDTWDLPGLRRGHVGPRSSLALLTSSTKRSASVWDRRRRRRLQVPDWFCSSANHSLRSAGQPSSRALSKRFRNKIAWSTGRTGDKIQVSPKYERADILTKHRRPISSAEVPLQVKTSWQQAVWISSEASFSLHIECLSCARIAWCSKATSIDDWYMV